MSPCERLRDHLEEAINGLLPLSLREHVERCETCQEVVALAQAWREVAYRVAHTPPSPSLLEQLRTMPRFPAACEDVLHCLGDALSGSLPGPLRLPFLAHLQKCQGCRATWEALATLREVGNSAQVPAGWRAAAALPPRQRLALRQRRGIFDVRLAVAAAYLFAALSVLLLGNPSALAERGAAQARLAGIYLRAAIENRLASLIRQLQERASSAGDWVAETTQELWWQVRQLLSGGTENPTEEPDV